MSQDKDETQRNKDQEEKGKVEDISQSRDREQQEKEKTPEEIKREWMRQFEDGSEEVQKLANMLYEMNVYTTQQLPLEITNSVNQRLQELFSKAGGSPVATTGGGGWLNTISQISEIVSKFQGPPGDEEELLLWRAYKKMALKKLITVGMKQMGLPVHEANDYHVKLER